ncbi:hypothetical protein JI435_102240 [Parastagonospora nodorum SN15]|uniref:Uncharacterized protein n=1 Tax=Phaeosphaeria nodorum (strain SN15 / ATCC MYA-4574 / FGSC 10173) TaxID=321614 RepID=A0A7U2F5Z2_PHANO|nr:hypothetical protein JI435_102240 [Parastagonospora nodorum SN15]
MRTTHPVCSASFKHRTGGLVVKWVTISESPLLNVFGYIFALFFTRNIVLDRRRRKATYV